MGLVIFAGRARFGFQAGKRLEEELGEEERRGRPKKSGPSGPDLEKGRTADIAAQKAGFRSATGMAAIRSMATQAAPRAH